VLTFWTQEVRGQYSCLSIKINQATCAYYDEAPSEVCAWDPECDGRSTAQASVQGALSTYRRNATFGSLSFQFQPWSEKQESILTATGTLCPNPLALSPGLNAANA
jgi:hypothetical protein